MMIPMGRRNTCSPFNMCESYLILLAAIILISPSSMRKCNTWRNSLIAGTLGGYGKRIQAHQFR